MGHFLLGVGLGVFLGLAFGTMILASGSRLVARLLDYFDLPRS